MKKFMIAAVAAAAVLISQTAHANSACRLVAAVCQQPLSQKKKGVQVVHVIGPRKSKLMTFRRFEIVNKCRMIHDDYIHTNQKAALEWVDKHQTKIIDFIEQHGYENANVFWSCIATSRQLDS